MAQQVQSEIRYLTPPSVDVKKKKYCRFKKSGKMCIRDSSYAVWVCGCKSKTIIRYIKKAVDGNYL